MLPTWRPSALARTQDSRHGPSRLRGFGLLPCALLLLAVAPALAATPPPGTHSSTWFCGTLAQVDAALTDYGIQPGDPFVGRIHLTQRPPDTSGPTTQWDCVNGASGCGEFELELPGFAPPQTAPETAEIHGPVATISQSVVTYHLMASLDDFLPGAAGDAALEFLCAGCPASNDPNDIKPSFSDQYPEASGSVAFALQVPGIGGGAIANGNGIIDTVGGRCRNYLPSTSPWGLAGLVALLVATALLFANRQIEAH